MCLCAAIQKALAALLSFSITQGVFGSKWIVCREHFILCTSLLFCFFFSAQSLLAGNSPFFSITVLLPFTSLLLNIILWLNAMHPSRQTTDIDCKLHKHHYAYSFLSTSSSCQNASSCFLNWIWCDEEWVTQAHLMLFHNRSLNHIMQTLCSTSLL